MSFNIYLSLTGKQQGLISAGCNTINSVGNKFQKGHTDEIQVISLNHRLSRAEHCNHHPIDFVKPVDKSSPLLGLAITENEMLTAIFEIYWLNPGGLLELFYKVKLTEASIVNIEAIYPHVIDSIETMPYEQVCLKYKSITWEHKIAGTSAYSIWDDRVY